MYEGLYSFFLITEICELLINFSMWDMFIKH